MFLKHLIIEKDGQVVRHIRFKLGVNLIVDTTPVDSEKQSGNNVGKTTVLRLVDYCLGGKATPIYQDPEFKTTNSTVKSFLETNNVIITLCLGESFDNSARDIILKRNFLPRREKLAEINGQNYSINNYCLELNQILFGITSSKPTLRQLISRFIRSDATKMDKVIRYLHATTTDNTYEGIYLFLFGKSDATELSSEKNELTQKLKFSKQVVSHTFDGRTASAIKQHLTLIASDIAKLEEQKANFNVNPQYEKEFAELQQLKNQINSLSSDLSQKKFRLDLIKESVQELQQQASDIDTEALKVVYEEAKLYIASLQKSFDDSVRFHNKLVANKLIYLSDDIPKLEAEILEKNTALDALLRSESSLGKRLVATGSLADYELMVSGANKKYEQKGRLEEELDKLQNLEATVDKCSKRIDEIGELIKLAASALEHNITLFNQYFSAYSEQFYDEKFVLSADFDADHNVYKFNISNVEGNLGDGKKKGLIAAFDLAYVAYANSKSIQSPHFVMHDRIEGIHGNQLKSLFDIVNSNEFNGQYVASVLSGKFSELQLSKNYLDDNKILELSQTEKLFRIENQSN